MKSFKIWNNSQRMWMKIDQIIKKKNVKKHRKLSKNLKKKLTRTTKNQSEFVKKR